MRVRDLDEGQLLSRIFALLPPQPAAVEIGPGDDGAVIRLSTTVASTDILVEGRHFQQFWSSPVDVGIRAANQNLADIAAMGARPVALVVGLGLPGNLPVAWVEGFARGLALACEPHAVAVVGGDLSSADQLLVAVTALGDTDGVPPVRRSGARQGAVVALAGTLGHSAAGLAWLSATHPPAPDALPDLEPVPVADELWPDHLSVAVRAYRRPNPPLLAGPAAAAAGATAMLDVSDGLLRDAGRICSASGVGINLERALLRPDVSQLEILAQELTADPWEWVLSGGEDHGLLAVFPSNRPLPAQFRRIGVVDDGEGVRLDGEAVSGWPGWDHFGGGR